MFLIYLKYFMKFLKELKNQFKKLLEEIYVNNKPKISILSNNYKKF